ncbi:MAG: tyrosine-type recombinase/integrase, partial [Cetobacterium sp.]
MNCNLKNLEIYQAYLDSNKARNYETINTTYKMYKSRMLDYLNYLNLFENDALLLSEETIKNSVAILERYINNCRDRNNNNQTI